MTVTIRVISTTNPASSIFFQTNAEVAASHAFHRHDEDVTTVENRNRQQVEQTEIEEADLRHQAEERNPSELGGFARELGDRDRSHQLLG